MTTRALEPEIQALKLMLLGGKLSVNVIPGTAEAKPQIWVSAAENTEVLFKITQTFRNRIAIAVEAEHREIGDITLNDIRGALEAARIIYECCITVLQIRERDFGWTTRIFGSTPIGTMPIADDLKDILLKYTFDM